MSSKASAPHFLYSPFLQFKKTYIIDYALLFAILAAFVLGFSKAGFKGLGFIVVSLMALAYTSKASTGVLLPLLIIADIFAIIFYRRDVVWKLLLQLFVPMAVGVLIGVWIGDDLSVVVFKQVMAGIIILSGILILFLNKLPLDKMPDNKAFAIIMGLAAGFTTMVGNLAGAFANIYFLAMRLPKREFIGTSAWLFFFINIFKLPFHIWVWKTIDVATFTDNLILIPFVIVGFFVGLKLISYVSNTLFQRYIIVITLLGAVLILIG